MFGCTSIKQVSQAAVFLSLLAVTMIVQAELPINGANSGSEVAPSVTDMQRGNPFPRWPQQRRQISREIIPPPPPGPYMSSALSNASVKGLSFGRDADDYAKNNPVSGFSPSKTPMSMFDPDRPWPENLRPENTLLPNHWMPMPAQGYRYLDSRTQNTPSVRQYRPSFTGPYDGYRIPGNMQQNNMPRRNLPARAYQPEVNGNAYQVPPTGANSRSGMSDYSVPQNDSKYRNTESR